jgi:hypothetical protein
MRSQRLLQRVFGGCTIGVARREDHIWPEIAGCRCFTFGPSPQIELPPDSWDAGWGAHRRR